MILICNDCDTKFKVERDSIDPQGRFVRCSSCGHEWLAQRSDLIEDTEDNQTISMIAEPIAEKAIEAENDFTMPKSQVAEITEAPPQSIDIPTNTTVENESVQKKSQNDLISQLDLGGLDLDLGDDSTDEPVSIPPQTEASAVSEVKDHTEEKSLDDVLAGLGDDESKSPTPTSTTQTNKIEEDSTDIDNLLSKLKKGKEPPAFYAKASIVITIKAFVAIALFILLYLVLIYQRELLSVKMPILEKAYEFMELSRNDGMRLTYVNCKIIDTSESVLYENTMEAAVEVEITNVSEITQKLNAIRFVIFDKKGVQIGFIVNEIRRVIYPGEATKIEGKLNHIPKDSTFVSVDIGNLKDLDLHNIESIKKI